MWHTLLRRQGRSSSQPESHWKDIRWDSLQKTYVSEEKEIIFFLMKASELKKKRKEEV